VQSDSFGARGANWGTRFTSNCRLLHGEGAWRFAHRSVLLL
jgi:hypothetical protein